MYKAFRIKHRIFRQSLFIKNLSIYRLRNLKSKNLKNIVLKRLFVFTSSHPYNLRYINFNLLKYLKLNNNLLTINIKNKYFNNFTKLSYSPLYSISFNLFNILYSIYIAQLSYDIHNN